MDLEKYPRKKDDERSEEDKKGLKDNQYRQDLEESGAIAHNEILLHLFIKDMQAILINTNSKEGFINSLQLKMNITKIVEDIDQYLEEEKSQSNIENQPGQKKESSDKKNESSIDAKVDQKHIEDLQEKLQSLIHLPLFTYDKQTGKLNHINPEELEYLFTQSPLFYSRDIARIYCDKEIDNLPTIETLSRKFEHDLMKIYDNNPELKTIDFSYCRFFDNKILDNKILSHIEQALDNNSNITEIKLIEEKTTNKIQKMIQRNQEFANNSQAKV